MSAVSVPALLPLRAEGIPLALRGHRRWAPFKAPWNARRGKFDKVPCSAKGYGLSTAAPQRWMGFEEALAAWQARPDLFAGVGYLMSGVHGVVGVDLDRCVDAAGALEPWAAEVVRELGGFAERSLSGTGVHVMVRGAVPEDWTNHERGIEVYAGHAARFLVVTGHVLPGCAEDLQPAPRGVLEALARRYARERTAPDPAREPLPDLVDELLLPELGDLSIPWQARAFLSEGEAGADRSRTLFATTVALFDAGLPADEVLSLLAANPHAMGVALDHRRQDPERALSYLWVEHTLKARGRAGSRVATVDDFVDVSPKAGEAPADPVFARDKLGAPLATLANVLAALRSPGYAGVRIGRDQFNDELMLAPVEAPGGSPQWRLFTDDDYTRLREALSRRGWKEIGRDLVRDAVALVGAENAFDSAQVWLDSLPAWDGVARCEGFMARYMKAEDNAYSRAVGAYLWTALAGRVLEPGCQADMVPTFISRQGAGKTRSAQALAPGPEHFVEINLSTRDDNLARSLRGKLVGELGELRGLAGRDAEDIKAWISRRHEEWVPKYKEFAVKFPRRLVLIGTTNEEEILADPTGNRRWLPLRVGLSADVDVAGIEADRDQLWAEGAALFRTGGVRWQDAERLARGVHHEHRVCDSWEDAVARWLSEPDALTGERPGERPHLRIGDVLAGAVGVAPRQTSRREEMRITKALVACGYARTRISENGARSWVYARQVSQPVPTCPIPCGGG